MTLEEHRPSEEVANGLVAMGRRRATAFREQLNRYTHMMRWVARDAIGRNRAGVLVAVTLNVVAVASQGAALAIVFAYARTVESGDSIDLPIIQRSFDARSDSAVLLFVTASALVLLLLSSFALFRARRLAVQLGSQYEEVSLRRTISLASRLPHPASPSTSAEFSRKRLAGLLAGCRYVGRVFMILINTLRDVGVVLVAGVGIFVLDFRLSLLVLTLLSVAGVFFYRVNIAAVSFSNRFQRASAGAALERKELVDRVRDSPAMIGADDEGMHRMFSTGGLKRFLDAWVGRLLVVETSSLVTQILFAVAVAAIVIFQGTAILRGSRSWGVLFVYLIALRFFLTNVTRVGRTVTSLNSFYPQVRGHFEFVEDAMRSEEPAEAVSEMYTVTTSVRPMHDDDDESVPSVDRGGHIGLISPSPLDRFVMVQIIQALQVFPARLRNSVLGDYFFPPPAPVAPIAPRHAYALRSEVSGPELSDVLRALGVEVLPEPVISGLDRVLQPSEWKLMSPETLAMLRIAACLLSEAELLILSARDVACLSESGRIYLSSRLEDRLLVIKHETVRTVPKVLEQGFILVCDLKQPLGWARPMWAVDHAELITAAISAQEPDSPSRADARDPIALGDEEDVGDIT